MQNSCNTIYPRKMVCFRYIIVNNMHKVDNKDCDDDDDDNNNNNNNNNVFTVEIKQKNVPDLSSITWSSAQSLSPLDNEVIYILVLNCKLPWPKRDRSNARFVRPGSKPLDSRIYDSNPEHFVLFMWCSVFTVCYTKFNAAFSFLSNDAFRLLRIPVKLDCN